jgi:opacity protein-like surface antigen
MRLKYLAVLVFITAGILPATAQSPKFSFNIPLGYTFDESASFDGGKLTAKGGFQYGGAFEFFASPTTSVELSYQRMATSFKVVSDGGVNLTEDEPEGSLNYILLGGNKYIDKGSKAMPYFGGGIGVGIMNSKGQSSTNFAFNFKAGVKVASGKSVALKLQAYAQSMTATFGSDYWVTGGGEVITYPDRAFLFQFGLGGVLCFDR